MSKENAVVDNGKDLTDQRNLWVCTVVAAFQGPEDTDGDPSGMNEEIRYGETGGYDGNDEFSVVFVEACREAYSSSFLSTNQTTLNASRIRYQRFITATVAHEIGHHPGLQSALNDHDEGLLMSNGLEEVNYNTFNNSYFSPKTLKRFRNCTRWAE